jgi:hypothetical protein
VSGNVEVVVQALASDFHGMTRNKLVGVIGVDLGVMIDGTKDLQRLLPKMRGDGLITSEKSTWFITDKGKAANTRTQILPTQVPVSLSLSLFCVLISFSLVQQATKTSSAPVSPNKKRQPVQASSGTNATSADSSKETEDGKRRKVAPSALAGVVASLEQAAANVNALQRQLAEARGVSARWLELGQENANQAQKTKGLEAERDALKKAKIPKADELRGVTLEWDSSNGGK